MYAQAEQLRRPSGLTTLPDRFRFPKCRTQKRRHGVFAGAEKAHSAKTTKIAVDKNNISILFNLVRILEFYHKNMPV